MGHDSFSAFPPRPASVGDWEEMLVRLELAPRAFRNQLEEVDPADAILQRAMGNRVAREVDAGEWLRAMASGAELRIAPDAEQRDVDRSGTSEQLRARFASLRARNFGWVQRRGLEVWEWSSDHTWYGRITANQLLCAMLRDDAEALAAIRSARRVREVAC